MATKDSVPWRVSAGAAAETGALSRGQIFVLASMHRVPADQLLTFSRKLQSFLKSDFDPRIHEELPPKVPKGGREALKAAKHLAAAGRELDKAQAILEQLHFRDMYGHTGRPNPAEKYRQDLLEAVAAVRAFERFVKVMERERYVVFKGTPDARAIRDLRREAVCFTAFGLWSDLDRPLTYTTDPLTSERGGKLFSFIQDVVSCVTEPMSLPSDAALRADLERFKAIQAEHLAWSHPK